MSRAVEYPSDELEETAELFRAQGFHIFGVADASDSPDREREYRDWLSRGCHGEMRYLVEHAAMKYRPAAILDGCRSVLVGAMSYNPGLCEEVASAAAERESGTVGSTADGASICGTGASEAVDAAGARTGAASNQIARYARGRDYHRVLGKRLKGITEALRERYPDDGFRSFVDATPLAERFYAAAAGIGFIGRNTLLINQTYGSWIVIGEILSTRHLLPHAEGGPPRTCPPDCRRCIEACPTRALFASRRIDARRCISYLTIENRGIIPKESRAAMGDRLFGCDRCQEVCPFNRRAGVTDCGELLSRVPGGTPTELRSVLGIRNDDEYLRRFAGTALMRAKRRGLLRNAAVVAGNLGGEDLLPELRGLAAEGDPVIAPHAEWAAERIQSLRPEVDS